MKVLILSSHYNSYSSESLIKSLKKQKIQTQIADPHDFYFLFNDSGTQYYYKNKPFKRPDLIIPRFGWLSYDFGLKLLNQFISDNCLSLNPSFAIEICHDKIKTAQFLKTNNFTIMEQFISSLTIDAQNYMPLLNKMMYLKSQTGSQGFGVTWAKDGNQLKSLIDLMRHESLPFLLQEDLSKYSEYRTYLIGKEYIQTYKKKKTSLGRNNFTQLDKLAKKQSQFASLVKVKPEQEDELRRCRQLLGLDFCAIDYFIKDSKIVIIDINSFPGFEFIETKLKIPIAKTLSDLIKSQLGL